MVVTVIVAYYFFGNWYTGKILPHSLEKLVETSDNKQESVITDTETEETTVALNGLYSVVRVVDGDTIIVDIDGEETRIRFIGVDTPESVNPDESKNTDEGKEASDWTKELLTNKSVYLEYDVDPQDDYGRTLAYVYLDDGKTMVNQLLLENGYAVTMTIQPNSKYADDFYNLQVAARKEKTGFWGTGFFE
jgi:micrococcal nuclease